MATKTTTKSKSKSQRFRDLFSDPEMTIAEAARKIGIGYAFAYGIATRTDDPHDPTKSLATTRAHRRGVRAVTVEDGVAVIRPTNGKVIRIDLSTGEVKRSAK